MQFEMTSAEYLEHEECYEGFCLSCGNLQGSCEPDAARYTCEICHKKSVYGVPELLIMGKVTIVERKKSILNDYINPKTSGGTQED